MSATVGGVTSAYAEQQLPFLSMHLVDRSPQSLGYFMQMRMIETIYLARLFAINAFDQPAVGDVQEGHEGSYSKIDLLIFRCYPCKYIGFAKTPRILDSRRGFVL